MKMLLQNQLPLIRVHHRLPRSISSLWQIPFIRYKRTIKDCDRLYQSYRGSRPRVGWWQLQTQWGMIYQSAAVEEDKWPLSPPMVMINKDLRPSKVTEIDMMKDLREPVCRLKLQRLPVPSTQSYQDPDSDYLNLPDMAPTYQFAH